MIGAKVTHGKFGGGTVTAIQNEVMTVRFAEEEKRFIYPDAFRQFLTLKDGRKQAKAIELIQRKENAAREKEKKRQQEQAQLQKMRSFKVAVNSQAVFDLTEADKKELLTHWQVHTGTYLSGSSRGEPRIPDRLRPNSACLLTYRPKESPEAERVIIGVFMVQESFFGVECKNGVIRAHPGYRIALPDAGRLSFWQYFEGTARPCWGKTTYKYMSNMVMKCILEDMKEKKLVKEEKIDDFLTYFCRMNGIRVKAAEEPVE